MENTTLIYLEQNGCYLMLHRIKKKNDINQGKWIGVGGHCEEGESPEQCAKREIWEETGLFVKNLQYRALITFVPDEGTGEYMHLFTATEFFGTLKTCSEGVLEWVPVEKITDLPLWEGDKIFLRLLRENRPFFTLRLAYEGDRLVSALLDGIDLIARPKLLISACLTGQACRYDGKSDPLPDLELLKQKYELIPVCPEVLGGLSIPREPCECREQKVISASGSDRTEAYRTGAEKALCKAYFAGCTKALLKAHSPSCGKKGIYDGSFTHTLVPGQGITAALLKQGGVTVYDETEISSLL